MEGGSVEHLQSFDQNIILLAHLAPEQEGAKNRHESEGKKQGTNQGIDHRESHRLEHFPFHTREGEERDVNNGDDQHAKEGWLAHIVRGRTHRADLLLHGQGPPQFMLPDADSPDDVLHHHHSTINDEPKIDRPETHQVAGDTGCQHPHRGEQKREGNGQRNNQGGTPIAEE